MPLTSLTNSGKGQIQQLFIFLMAIIVIGATVFLGTKLFSGVEDTSCETRAATFSQDLKELLGQQTVLGSRMQVKIHTPCEAEQLCFIDSRDIGNPNFSSEHGIIQSAVRANVATNLYLIDGKNVRPAGFDQRVLLSDPDPVAPPGSTLCINTTGSEFRFITEGYGRFVKVRP